MSVWLPPYLSVRRTANGLRLGILPPLAWDVEDPPSFLVELLANLTTPTDRADAVKAVGNHGWNDEEAESLSRRYTMLASVKSIKYFDGTISRFILRSSCETVVQLWKFVSGHRGCSVRTLVPKSASMGYGDCGTKLKPPTTGGETPEIQGRRLALHHRLRHSTHRTRRAVGVTARVVSRVGLVAGDEVSGPALIEQPDTTTLLATDEIAVVDDAGNLVVRFGS